MTDDMEKPCKGCFMYERYKKNPESFVKCAVYNKDLVCPCMDCLIKVMCIKACDDYFNYCETINLRRR